MLDDKNSFRFNYTYPNKLTVIKIAENIMWVKCILFQNDSHGSISV